jgi:hypothetical protein
MSRNKDFVPLRDIFKMALTKEQKTFVMKMGGSKWLRNIVVRAMEMKNATAVPVVDARHHP